MGNEHEEVIDTKSGFAYLLVKWRIIVLVALAAVIVLRKNTTVKVLDVIVPVMAVFYFGITIFVIINNEVILKVL